MASVEPSPLTRLKIFQAPDSHPVRSFQSYDTRSRTPTKLPIRKGTDIGAALYRSPTRSSLAKRNPKLLRRSPYAGKPANGSSSQDTEGRGRLNFGAGAMVGAGSGGGVGGSGRVGGVGGPGFSSSPAGKGSSLSSAAGDPNGGSEQGSPVKGEPSRIVGGSTEGPERPTKQPTKKNPGGAETEGSKLQGGEASPKRERTWGPDEEFEEKRRSKVRKMAEMMEAKVRELQTEIEDLNAEVKTQEMRIERETTELAKSSESDVEALMYVPQLVPIPGLN